MAAHIVRILDTLMLTPDVKRFELEKPDGYSFNPGQATDVSINQPGWEQQLRPFTFTCLPDDHFLEFTIKTYPSHKGVTAQLLQLQRGDELIVHDVFGDIAYKGEGVFIAGGAGVTPFIAIFRHLHKTGQLGNNMLIFANNTRADIIHEEEFSQHLGKAFVNILAKENINGYYQGFITTDFLKTVVPDFSKRFYVCGPPPMMDAVLPQLKNLGVAESSIIVEGF